MFLSVAQSTVVCVAGQCLQGFSNLSLGILLSAPGAPSNIQLLPGLYTSSTGPQFLHESLTNPSATLTPSHGFENSTKLSLPLNVALQPGFALFPQPLYSGQPSFTGLQSDVSPKNQIQTTQSIAISSDVWLSVSSSNRTLVLWDSVPDVSQIPTISSGLSVLQVQSASCSSACSSSGKCSPSGTCICPTGFAGSSCESCSPGFFGPSCQPCPSGCASCADGITGTGVCLQPSVQNLPQSCNCLNGVCSGGQCQCNPGWATATNGTACAKCAPGFFLTASGDCKVCAIGCAQCADGTGNCNSCEQGFVVSTSDATQCSPQKPNDSTGTPCLDGSFFNGTSCAACSSACRTCTGPTANNCVECADGTFFSNGLCVSANAQGICANSNLIADNNKRQCNTCGAKCTACQIPGFTNISKIGDAQCTKCIAGSVLSKGQCLASCPAGTFISPQDNLTCTACTSPCSACAGSSNFCLACSGSQFAFNGKCVSSCPTGSFSSNGIVGSGTCTSCHPDCASCSGSSFAQCTSCPPNRPVLSGGRCLPTCPAGRSQYFDAVSSSCNSCDVTCASCSGPGPNSCLSCASTADVLNGGTCINANCQPTSTSVLPGLGVCLSQLVATPAASPLPTITGLDSPAKISRGRLAWWQILLMALGCAFVLLVLVLLWRRYARRRRAKHTEMFASAKAIRRGWRERVTGFFGRKRNNRGVALDADDRDLIGLKKMREMREQEQERHYKEIEKLMDAYEVASSRAGAGRGYEEGDELEMGDDIERSRSRRNRSSQLSAESLYSQITGESRRVAEPRVPVKKQGVEMSRFSMSTLGRDNSGKSGGGVRSIRRKTPPLLDLDIGEDSTLTEAGKYARTHKPKDDLSEASFSPMPSTSSGGKNPFRR